MPISADDRRLDQVRFLALYSRLCSIQYSTLVNRYDYYSIKRMVSTLGEGIDARGDDPLAARLVSGIQELPTTVREGATELELDPPASVSALFQESTIARDLKPKLWVGLDLSDGDLGVCGLLTACSFLQDESLSTSKLSPSYLSKNGLPRLDDAWMLVDVVASSKRGTGALLLLNALITAARAKYTGVASVAVSKAGRRLFQSFGFRVDHGWKERGGMRYLCTVKLTELHLGDVHARLRVHDDLVSDVCWREGLTASSRDRLISRCA